MVSVKHKFVSQKGDGPDSTLVQPSDWNDEHDITVSATNRILGRISAGGGDVEELTGADIRTIADVYSKSEVYTKAEAGGGFGLMEDVASASTTNLGSVAGRNVRITGSATIASFGSGASLDAPVYLLTFTGAATLQNSANLILPGGDDIVTSAGDTAIAVYLGSGAWRVIAYNGLATEADARSGTVTGKLMDPLRTKQAIEEFAGGGRLIGEVIPYAGNDAPGGWLLCDGQEVSRTTYSALFDVIGITYGDGDGVNTFNVPDLRGRVVAGRDDMGGSVAGRLTDSGNGNPGIDGTVLGASGGADRHQLTVAQMPSHSHSGVLIVNTIGAQYNLSTGSNASSSSTGLTGGGQPHPNVQPTIILNYLIYAGA